MLNKDYKDILESLLSEGADFVLVGAYALAAHGFPRATMDIDIWVNPSSDNADKVYAALSKFGAPTDQISVKDLSRSLSGLGVRRERKIGLSHFIRNFEANSGSL